MGSVLTGAPYFPSVDVCYSGNMTAGQALATNCFAIVANDVHFTGNSSLAVDGCAADSVSVPQVVVAAITE